MIKKGLQYFLRPLAPHLLVAGIIKHRWAVIGVIFLLTGIFAAFLPKLTISTSVYDLVIEDIPENREYLDFKKLFGNEEIIRVVIKSDHVFDPLVFNKLDALSQSCKTIEGIQRVISLPEIKRAVDLSGNWPLKKFEQLFAGLDLLKNNLISKDRKTTLITLVLADTAHPEKVVEQIQALIDNSDPGLRLYQIGMPLLSQALGVFTERDFMHLPPITFAIIALILLILFMRPAYVLLPLLCVFISLTWTFGIMALTGVPLSMLTMIVPVFLIAVGTAYCLHIIAAHREASSHSQTANEAVMITFRATAFATLLAIGTTVLSLCTLFSSGITAIKEFALFATVGMMCFLTVLSTLLPAALSYLVPTSTRQPGKRYISALVKRLIDGIITVHLHHQKKALIVIGIIAVFCLGGLIRLKVETNPIGFFKETAEVHKNFHDIYQHLSGSFPINLTIAGPEADFFESPDHIKAIDQVQRFLQTQPGVDKTISFADYLKLVNYASNGFKPEYYQLPQESWETRMLINNYKSLLGDDMLRAFMNEDFTHANILLLTHLSNSSDFLRLKKDVMAQVPHGFIKDLKWQITGFGMVISASSRILTLGQIKSLSLTLACIVVIMLILFMSIKVGLIAALTNLFPIIVNFGIMGWLGIELSMATSLIASVAIGLAVDDTIHYLVRFNNEFRIDLDDRRALKETLSHIGQPIIYTTITIGLGFCVLLFSNFKPTAIFGGMMIITMGAALVGDMILLPALMQRVELITLWDLVRIKMGRDPGLEIPLFKGFSRTELHSVLMAGTIVDFNRGETLFNKGETSQTMYVVISGEFDVLDYNSEASFDAGDVYKKVNSCMPGDIIGEMGLLREAPRSATVVATEESELLLINWKVIQRLQWLYPPTAVKFFKNISEELCNRVERLTHCLANESCTDDLTGLCNRRGMCQIIESELKRAIRYQEPLGVCLVEVTFNRTGDKTRFTSQEALGNLVHSWCTNIRNCDFLGRISTDRFLALLPKIPDNHIDGVIQRLHAATKQTPIKGGEATVTFKKTSFHFPLDSLPNGEQAIAEALKKIGIDDTEASEQDNTCDMPPMP